MGKGSQKTISEISWEEVKKHNTFGDAWIVINESVYNVSKWSEHPGKQLPKMITVFFWGGKT